MNETEGRGDNGGQKNIVQLLKAISLLIWALAAAAQQGRAPRI